jgi:hypothetical protein
MGESYEGHAKVKMSRMPMLEKEQEQQGKEERSLLLESGGGGGGGSGPPLLLLVDGVRFGCTRPKCGTDNELGGNY